MLSVQQLVENNESTGKHSLIQTDAKIDPSKAHALCLATGFPEVLHKGWDGY